MSRSGICQGLGYAAAGSAVTMEISAASTASGGAGATKAEEAASTNVQAPMGTAPSTASSDSLASPSFGVDAPILQEMLLFFVHLALNACSSWGAPPPPQAALVGPSSVCCDVRHSWLLLCSLGIVFWPKPSGARDF